MACMLPAVSLRAAFHLLHSLLLDGGLLRCCLSHAARCSVHVALLDGCIVAAVGHLCNRNSCCIVALVHAVCGLLHG